MAQGGNDRSFYSPCAQQKHSNILCFWETQPLGCVRIGCVFQHSKPRNINGLFLPPTNNTVFQQQGQEGILNSAHSQEFHRIQENIVIPIHPPVVVDLSNEEDEDEDEEEDEVKNISVTLERTAADIEEERAIKEVCYKSGEYYRVQYPQILQSTEIVPPSPCLESEQLPMDTVEPYSWTGDNNMKRERETSGMKVSMKCISRTNDKSYENKDISVTLERTAADIEEERAIKEVCYKSGEYYRVQYPQILQSTEIVPPSPCLESEQLPMDTVEPYSWTGDNNMKRERETSGCHGFEVNGMKVSMKCISRTNDKSYENKGDNNMKRERETSGMKVSMKCISRMNDKSYENKGGDYFAAQRNKYFNGKRTEPVYFEKTPTTSKYSNVKATNSSERVRKYHFKGVKKKNWISEEQRNNSPNTGTGKGIPTSYSKVKPNYQQNYHRRDDETASSIRSVRQTERNIYFNSSEPQRSAYVFYRNGRVMQEPVYNGSTADKYYSASCNTPPWRKRNPHAKTFSKFKTTAQGQDMEKKK